MCLLAAMTSSVCKQDTPLWQWGVEMGGGGRQAVSSSAFPAISLGFTIFGEVFVYVTVFVVFFFYPTIEVVTFCLCGGCMLSVCLLLALTRQGHECQDLLSQCSGMHVYTY